MLLLFDLLTRARRPHARSGRIACTLLSLALALACLPAGTGHAEELPPGATPGSLVALMDHFANSGTVRAEFKETRTLSLLVEAIETEGVLYFSPPDRLAHHTTHPGNARVVVHGGRVAFRDETGTRTLDLGSSDVARSLTDNLMVLLRGDLAGLRERYSIAFTSDGHRWQLDLEPRLEAVRAIIEGIRFSGLGWTLEAMETRETNGDTALVIFSRIETQLELSPPQHEQIFSIDPLDDNAPSGSQTPVPSHPAQTPANP